MRVAGGVFVGDSMTRNRRQRVGERVLQAQHAAGYLDKEGTCFAQCGCAILVLGTKGCLYTAGQYLQLLLWRSVAHTVTAQ